MQKFHPEKKDKLWAMAGSLVFSVILLVLCLFLGFKIPFPLPDEQGVEISLGDSKDGLGSPSGGFYANETTEQAFIPQETQDNSSTISTQSTEESINLTPEKKKDREKKPQEKPTQTETQQPKPPTVNPNAIYGGKTTGTTGGGHGTANGTGQGNTSGDGFMGDPNGDANSTHYDGAPGGGGSGVSFSLKGRSSNKLEKPIYTSKDQGTVVVKIWVDRQGNVVKAQAGERGTTVTDSRLYEKAEQAALKSSFSSDPNASDMQIGTITYKFIIGGM